MEKWAKSQNNKKSTFVAKKTSVVRTAVAAAAVFVPQVKSSFESVPAIEEREEDKETEKEVAAEQVAECSPGAEQQSKVLIKYLTRQMLNVASLKERTTRIIKSSSDRKKINFVSLCYCSL